MPNKQQKLGVVIIAAGNSSRLGEPKQLIKYKQNNLLQRSLNLAAQISEQVVCVLGYDANTIRERIKVNTQQIIINENWPIGMGSSIAIGVKHLSKKVDAILILLCDQYLLSRLDLDKLFKQWNENNFRIIASQYFEEKQNRLIEGAPAIFPRAYFNDLMALKEKGARDILKNNQQQLITVLIEHAAFDLDTKNDLKQLQNMEKNND